MARQAKPGIEYYQMDSDHTDHRKIKLLFSEYDSDGFWIWSNLVDEAYNKKGYYFDLSNDDDLILFASDRCKKPLSLVRNVIECCIKRDLFDKGIAEKYNILTSDRIQEGYLFATYQRRFKGTSVFMYKEYILTEIKPSDLNIIIMPLDNDFIPSGSQAKKDPVKEASVVKVEKTEDEQVSDIMKKQWEGLKKSKKDIADFISINKPKLAEPYVALWNIWAEERKMPQVTTINKIRRGNLSARLKEKGFDFISILKIASTSELILKGTWFTYDWVMGSTTNYVKVLEGNYNNKAVEKKENGSTAADEWVNSIVQKKA